MLYRCIISYFKLLEIHKMAFSNNDKQIRDVLEAGGIKCGNSSSTVDKYKKIARNEGATDHESIITTLSKLYLPTKQKTKDKAIRGVEAKLLHIRTPENKRKAVWLEPTFYDALGKVTADKNQAQWLTDILVNVGDGNLASAVRCSIVKELMA